MGRFTNYIILSFLLSLLLISGFGSWLSAQDLENQDKPNIILIYIDDMGYSDVAEYGKEYGQNLTETPNMDRLVKEGKKFTSAYASAPLCSPSRAALLTGKTPARLNFEFVTKNETDDYSWDDEEWIKKFEGYELVPPPFTLNLPLEEVTVAEALKKGGYETAISGKWHVAAHNEHYLGWSSDFGPEHQGFDFTAETFGSHPYSYIVGGEKKNSKEYKKGEYPVDALTDRAVDFIKKDHQKPFFLYVSHYYVHTPVEVNVQWLIDKYRKKAGPDLSEERVVYAAFVEIVDHYVGQLLDAIDKEDLTDDTVVILTSDNGGHPVYAFTRPFRGSKWNVYEGGIRVPFIVRWPGVANAGSESDGLVSQIDLKPTFMELAGVENYEQGLDGKSIVPLFYDDEIDTFKNRTLYWHFPYYHPEGGEFEKTQSHIGLETGYVSQTLPQSAMRKGNLKLVYFYDGDKAELYDLAKDPSEQNDLSSERPWDTQMMKAELLQKLHEAGARFPRVNSKKN